MNKKFGAMHSLNLPLGVLEHIPNHKKALCWVLGTLRMSQNPVVNVVAGVSTQLACLLRKRRHDLNKAVPPTMIQRTLHLRFLGRMLRMSESNLSPVLLMLLRTRPGGLNPVLPQVV